MNAIVTNAASVTSLTPQLRNGADADPSPRPAPRETAEKALDAPSRRAAEAAAREEAAAPNARASERSDPAEARANRETAREESALREAVERAARQNFEPRAVDVEGFYDEDSGRFVVKIADQESGEVIAQSPPDELLRYFAQSREALGPLLTLDA